MCEILNHIDLDTQKESRTWQKMPTGLGFLSRTQPRAPLRSAQTSLPARIQQEVLRVLTDCRLSCPLGGPALLPCPKLQLQRGHSQRDLDTFADVMS